MSLQDPEPPREALEKLALDSVAPPSRDVTISDASYETSDEACLRLLHQNDDLEAENHHLRQQLSQPSDTQWVQIETARPRAARTWPIVPMGPLGCFSWHLGLNQQCTQLLRSRGFIGTLPRCITGPPRTIDGSTFLGPGADTLEDQERTAPPTLSMVNLEADKTYVC
jgi:hypothetical protein